MRWAPIAAGLSLDRFGRGGFTWTPDQATVGSTALIRATANRSGRAKRYWETSDLDDASSVQWPGDGKATSLAPLWVRSALGRDFTRPEISDMPQLYHLDAMAYESVIVGLFAIHRGRFAMSSDGRPVEPGRP